MAGVKGKSGRKPVMSEKSLTELLNVSHDILFRWMTNPDVPEEKRAMVASELIKRRIPNVQKHEGLGIEFKLYQQIFNQYSPEALESLVDALRESIEQDEPLLLDGEGETLDKDENWEN